jgi:L-alanine-DL-glutamate epimerase-like enolase superfamily enzyme
MEVPADDKISPKKDIVKTDLKVEKGYLNIPETPGIGAVINEEVIGHPDFAHTLRGAKAIVMDDGSCTNR